MYRNGRRKKIQNVFQEKTIVSNCGMFAGKISLKDPVELIKWQMKSINERTVRMEPQHRTDQNGEQEFGHIMETSYGWKIYNYMKEKVMKCRREDATWFDETSSSDRSFTGILQLYSDKTVMTLKKNGVKAYPVHLVLMNFEYPEWKAQIMEENTLVGYLPVEMYEVVDDLGFQNGAYAKGIDKKKIRREILQKALKQILKPLENIQMTGITTTIQNGMRAHCHPMIGIISSDMVELKELSCIYQGSNTTRPCPKCLVGRTVLNDDSIHTKRSIMETRLRRRKALAIDMELNKSIEKNHPSRVKKLRLERADILKAMSILEVESLFESSCLIMDEGGVDLYDCLCFEPMHNVQLGTSKTCKSCIFLRLGRDDKFITVNGRKKMFKSIRRSVLKSVNEILSRMQVESYVPDFRVDFSSKESSTDLNGLYTNDGLVGMLEAKNFKCLDTIFPFVCAFIDRVCQEGWGPLTSIYSIYNDVIAYTFDRDSSNPWKQENVEWIRFLIFKLKKLMVAEFGYSHPSNLNTVKFHMLGHLPEDICNIGDIRMADVQFFENRHLTFKEECKRTSRRADNVQAHTINRVERRLMINLLKNKMVNSKKRGRREGLCGRGYSVALSELRQLLLFMKPRLEYHEKGISNEALQDAKRMYSPGSISLFVQLGDQGMETLLRTIHEFQNGLEETTSSTLHTSIEIVKSGIVKGGYCCTLDDVDSNSLEIVRISRKEVLWQRYLATESYMNSTHSRYSFVIMEGTVNERTVYWIGQVRALFRIGHGKTTNREMAFVQFLEVTTAKDEIEKIHGCVNLRWSTDDEVDRTVGIQNGYEDTIPSPWFALIETKAILGVVQVIKQYYNFNDFLPEIHWSKHRYCLNRFQKVGSSMEELLE